MISDHYALTVAPAKHQSHSAIPFECVDTLLAKPPLVPQRIQIILASIYQSAVHFNNLKIALRIREVKDF